MKRTTRNAAKTKQEIIRKSAPLFNVYGYAGTKMQMLVDATGYQMGGIYRHFDTKMDLAKAAFQYNYETLVKPNLKLNSQLTPKEQLISIFEKYKKGALSSGNSGGCPLLNSATEVDDTDEDFREITKASVEEVVSIMEQILEEGKTSGFFYPAIDSRKEAQYLFATVEGAIMMKGLAKDSDSFLAIFERTFVYIEEKIFQDPQ